MRYSREARSAGNLQNLRTFPSSAHVETHYVSANGGIRWNRRWVNVSVTCIREYVGLEEVGAGIWTVYFGPLKLGRLLEQHLRIEDAHGRPRRHRVLPMSPD